VPIMPGVKQGQRQGTDAQMDHAEALMSWDG
jgi:hypothetical protein